MTDYHHAAPKKRTGRRLAEGPRPDEPEWVAEARRLRRQERWSYQHIADHLGKSYRQVYKQLNWNRVRETNQRSEDKNRAAITARTLARLREKAPNCVYCARVLSKPPRSFPPVCRACRVQRGSQRRAAIAGLWLAGYSSTEIAMMFGSNPNAIGSVVSQLRQEGIPIPYKRLPRKDRFAPYDEMLTELEDAA